MKHLFLGILFFVLASVAKAEPDGDWWKPRAMSGSRLILVASARQTAIETKIPLPNQEMAFADRRSGNPRLNGHIPGATSLRHRRSRTTSANRDRYREFCESGVAVPIFCKPWWLDAVCGTDNWDVALVDKDGHLLGSMPYYSTKLLGQNLITMPKFTTRMGPFITHLSNQKYAGLLHHDQTIMNELIDQIPDSMHFHQDFDYRITDGLPFHWRNFTLNVRYTYVIENLSNLNDVWLGFQQNARRHVRNSSKVVTVRSDLGIDRLMELSELTQRRQNLNPIYTRDRLHALHSACSMNDAGRLFFAEDDKGRLHAGLYLVWDENAAYYLIGGGDPCLRNSGATSLLMWKAIEFAATVTKSFDFNGSMKESIQQFFRSFGAKQKSYLSVSKTNHLMKVLLEYRKKYLSLNRSWRNSLLAGRLKVLPFALSILTSYSPVLA